MSTVLFGIDTLANVVCAATAGAPEGDAKLGVMRTLAKILGHYSTANCKAYRTAYAHIVGTNLERPATAAQILDRALELQLEPQQGSRLAAREFLGLATYNLDAFETVELAASIRTLRTMVGA